MDASWSQWGLHEGEWPVDGAWPCVVNARRSGGQKALRVLGGILLSGALKRALVKRERVFWMVLTNTGVLAIKGLSATILRIDARNCHVTDTGERRTMPTVVRGSLAGVTIAWPGQAIDVFLPERALPALAGLGGRAS